MAIGVVILPLMGVGYMVGELGRAKLDAHQERQIDSLVRSLQVPTQARDKVTALAIVDGHIVDEHIVGIIVQDDNFRVLASRVLPERRIGRQRTISRAVLRDGRQVGVVSIEVDTSLVDSQVKNLHTGVGLAIIVQFLLLGSLMSYFLFRHFLIPLRQVTRHLSALSRLELQRELPAQMAGNPLFHLMRVANKPTCSSNATWNAPPAWISKPR